MDLFTGLIIIGFFIFFEVAIIQTQKISRTDPNNSKAITLCILILILIMFLITFYNQNFQSNLWKGNELTLLKTNKSLNVALQPLYNILVFIFKKNEIINYLNIFLISIFFLIYNKAINLLKANKKIVLSLFFLILPFCGFFILNSLEDNFWGIGLTLFLLGHFLGENDKNYFPFQIIGGIICLLFKEWLALSLILYLTIDYINELFFNENKINVYGFFIFTLIIVLFYTYSIIDVIRYIFFYLTFYLILSFSLIEPKHHH